MPTESVKCDILFDFDNDERVITSGQSLSGQVVLTFFKPKYLLGKIYTHSHKRLIRKMPVIKCSIFHFRLVRYFHERCRQSNNKIFQRFSPQ